MFWLGTIYKLLFLGMLVEKKKKKAALVMSFPLMSEDLREWEGALLRCSFRVLYNQKTLSEQ